MEKILMLFSAILLLVSCESKTGKSEPVILADAGETIVHKGYHIGDEATDFKLENIDGKLVSLSDYRDSKGFLVIFTCNHCPYAIAYEDRIIALDKKYRPLGYPVIAINPNDPEVQPEDSMEEMRKRAADKGFTFPY